MKQVPECVSDCEALGAFFVDCDGIIESVNSGFESLIGETKDRLLGRSIVEVLSLSGTQGDFRHGFEVARKAHESNLLTVRIREGQFRDQFATITLELLKPPVQGQACFLGLMSLKNGNCRTVEERFTNLVDNVPGMVYQYVESPNGTDRFTYVSAASNDLFGLTQDEVVDSPRELWRAIHTQDLDTFTQSIKHSKRTLTDWEYEWSSWHRDGSLRRLHGRSKVTKLANGEYVWDGVIMDVTDRYHAEVELTKSRLRRKAIVDHALDAILLADDDGNFIEANQSACDLLGYSLAELMAMRVQDIIAEPIRPSDGDISWRRFLDAGLLKGSVRLFKKDGTPILADYSAVANVLPGLHLSILSDVTERINAEEALRIARYSLDHAIIGIEWVRPDGSFFDANQVAHESLGYTREEFLKLHVYDIDCNLSKRKWEANWQNLKKRAMLCVHSTHIHKNGREIAVEINANYVKIGQEELCCTFVRDISHDQEAAAEKRQLERQLQEAQKLEAIGTLAGGIAHDFNNYLGAILGNVTLAKLDTSRESPAWESITEIDKAAHKAKHLVQQILTFSRHQSQERPTSDLVPIVEDSVSLLHSVLPSGIRIVSNLSSRALFSNVDANQISQVLLNLCTNAWQAMDSGRGTIEIELSQASERDVETMLSTEKAAACYARISVADDGKGIPRESIDRIFEPFFTTKGAGQGTGLGLAVVHGIVKSHEGVITVQSKVGIGTTITIFLPLCEGRHKLESQQSTENLKVEGEGQHVLYVDDDDAMLSMVRRILTRSGYKVSTFDHPDKALAAFRENPGQFDLVVTDQNMPGASGIDVAREVHAIRPGMPVALISGYLSDDLVHAAEQVNVIELIYKPNTVDELCEIIRKVTSGLKKPVQVENESELIHAKRNGKMSI